MTNQEITTEEGTISFGIKAGSVDYGGGDEVNLGQFDLDKGEITILKDKNQNLQVVFATDDGEVRLMHNVSNIDPDDKHMVALTWNKANDEIKLHFDGSEQATSQFPQES